MQYASPITSVVENQDADVKNNEAINPSSDTIKRCEIYKAFILSYRIQPNTYPQCQMDLALAIICLLYTSRCV